MRSIELAGKVVGADDVDLEEALYLAAMARAYTPVGSVDLCWSISDGESSILCYGADTAKGIVEGDEVYLYVFHRGQLAYLAIVRKRPHMTEEAEAEWKARIVPIVRSALIYGLRGPDPSSAEDGKPATR